MTQRSTRRVLTAILFGVVVTALGFALGSWQTRRGDEKAALQARLEAAETAAPVVVNSKSVAAEVAAALPRAVRLRGEFLPEHTVFVDNRWLDGAAGFYVITPLHVTEELTVLVNRGWVARDSRDPARVPKVELPPGPATIDGLAVARVPRLLELGQKPVLQVPGIWPNLEPGEYGRVSGLAVAEFVVQQTSAMPDNLRRAWPRPSAGIEKHRGYALQWYGLAVLSAGLTIFFGVRALREQFR